MPHNTYTIYNTYLVNALTYTNLIYCLIISILLYWSIKSLNQLVNNLYIYITAKPAATSVDPLARYYAIHLNLT